MIPPKRGDVETAALKVITLPHSDDEIEELRNEGYDEESISARYLSYAQEILQEYRIMAKMKGDSNIVDCDDIQYEHRENSFGWNFFIKMELLTPLTKDLGKDISDISDEKVIQVGIDMCKALKRCTEMHIIHRDIKPQNILVSNSGQYKLGDFGVAKVSDRLTTGTKVGTYKYMAPEVYNNQPYDSRADICSLGLVLYWMLNERSTPFLPLPPTVPTGSMEEEARDKRFRGEKIPPTPTRQQSAKKRRIESMHISS